MTVVSLTLGVCHLLAYLTFCPALVKDPAMNVTENGENLPTQNRSMRAPEAGPGQEAQDLGAQGEL